MKLLVAYLLHRSTCLSCVLDNKITFYGPTVQYGVLEKFVIVNDNCLELCLCRLCRDMYHSLPSKRAWELNHNLLYLPSGCLPGRHW